MRNVTPPVPTTQIKSEEGESHDEIGENLPKSSNEPIFQELMDGFYFTTKGKSQTITHVEHWPKTVLRSDADTDGLETIKTGTLQTLCNLMFGRPSWTLSTMSSDIFSGLPITIPRHDLHSLMHSSLYPFLGSWVRSYVRDPRSLWRTHHIRVPGAWAQANISGGNVFIVAHLRELEPMRPKPQSPEPSCAPSSGRDRQSAFIDKFLGFHPRLLAQHLTCLDAELFWKVVPQQCIRYIRPRENTRTSTVQAVLAQNQRLTKAIVMTCMGDMAGACLKHWAKVAEECQRLRNMASLNIIFSALLSFSSNSSISGLPQYWKTLKRVNDIRDKDLRLIKNLSLKENISIFSILFNTSKRTQYLWQKKGVVPPLNNFLEKLAMNKTSFRGERRRVENDILYNLTVFQRAAGKYKIKPVEAISSWLCGVEDGPRMDSIELCC